MKDVTAYIGQFPAEVQEILRQIRSVIIELAPYAEESLSYGMPAYKLNKKPLVYYAGYKKHIGFYATPQGHEAFAEELSKYKQGKGSVQFPLDSAIPYDLIKRMVSFRIAQNQGL